MLIKPSIKRRREGLMMKEVMLNNNRSENKTTEADKHLVLCGEGPHLAQRRR